MITAKPSKNSALSLGELPTMVGFHLRRAHSAALRELDQKLGRMQLTTAMHGALEILSCNAAVSQSVLAQALGLTRSSMVPIVDKLEDRGYVERVRLEEDRRAVLVKLTPEGRKQNARLRRIVREHEERLNAALAGCDMAQLTAALERLTALGPSA
ncbi:MarR family winged helix-turn-helix transcriptional regulator [Variovorax terrae]|uniref:MarR family transcriptional regulator n=1 Tax=Variovorax terrae TaxID=2923278 RepID=A0A9X1W090_9BURK|nr:MarR family transcriptional regulator [Variovorax terrae]MCJ0765419.1 MarR family transcriptional regulator [Variovorax terrae]